ncbi:MAG: hypothetical protein E7643_01840 [Ruminococcaceae bacterium]|nr:hypothetical protein [Oscillospiraceae bacterium]
MYGKTDEPLDIIIPISIELDWPTCEEVVKCIREQNQKYGFTKFALAAPAGGWRSTHYPPREHFIDRAKLFASVKTELAPQGLTLGWWITATLKSGPSEEFVRTVRSDGSESQIASCPADPAFEERFCGDIAAFAEIAHPDFIITEDDCSLRAATFSEGCFCKYHLEAFARREGRAYTREELVKSFAQRDAASYALLRRWRALMKDTLVEFAAAMRHAIDSVAPEIPMGYMQSGGADWDGDCTEAVSRAMAGERHVPFSRLYGCFYCGGETKSIPHVLYHPIYCKQHIGENFRFYHESDTFPHTAFFTSAEQMRAMMATVYSYGFHGSTFQTQQLLDDPNEEEIYGRMFKEERARFEVIGALARQCVQKGVQICYDPFWNTADDTCSTEQPLWTRCVSAFGLPYTTLASNAVFWDVRQAKYASDEEVTAALSKKALFLDGDAARVLCERGFEKYLGVSVGARDIADGRLGFDLGARELITERFCTEGCGKHMPSAHMYAVGKNGCLLEMRVSDPTCEVISELYTFEKKFVSVAMTRYKNSLGGTVTVMGETLDGNASQSLFNYRRQRLFGDVLSECADEFVFVKESPFVSVVMNEAKDPKESGFFGLLTMTNLCDGTVTSPLLHLPPCWNTFASLSFLAKDGSWQALPYTQTSDGIRVEMPMKYCDPMYLRFS